mgnify:CR=1 FL=1
MNYSKKCPICLEGRKKLETLSWSNYKVIHCNKCNLDYCSSMKEKEIGGDSSPVHKEGIEMMAATLDKTKELAQNYVDRRIPIFESYLKRKCNNVLEVGCGAGVFYNPFKKKFIEWDGIDINPYWNLFGKNNNIPISNKPLDQIKKKYDVILAYQVLEHVESPIPFMESIISNLNPGGIVHLELPNQSSLNSRIRQISPLISKDYGFIQPPMHLRAYQKTTLEYMFRKVGLDIKKIIICGNTDKYWGQVRDYNLMQKTLYKLSGKIGYGSLLIGLAQRPF